MSKYVENFQNLGITNIDDAVAYLDRARDQLKKFSLPMKQCLNDINGDCSFFKMLYFKKKISETRFRSIKN